MSQAADLKKRSLKLTQRLDLSLTSTWRSFENLVACLVAANALEPDTLRPLPLGNIARQIHGDNELWLAMMLTNPAVQASPAFCFTCLLEPGTSQESGHGSIREGAILRHQQ